MELFDFLKLLYTKSASYEALNNYERSRFFFMVNRFQSMKFPHVANEFNHLEINSGQAVNVWHDMMHKFNGTPKWLWDGMKKDKVEEKTITATDEIINFYCKLNEITHKEFERLIVINKKQLQKELNELKDYQDNKINKK